MQDEKKKLQAVVVINFVACGLISHLIGRRTMKMVKSNQSVHGFWICKVKFQFYKIRLYLLLLIVPSLPPPHC